MATDPFDLEPVLCFYSAFKLRSGEAVDGTKMVLVRRSAHILREFEAQMLADQREPWGLDRLATWTLTKYRPRCGRPEF